MLIFLHVHFEHFLFRQCLQRTFSYTILTFVFLFCFFCFPKPDSVEMPFGFNHLPKEIDCRENHVAGTSRVFDAIQAYRQVLAFPHHKPHKGSQICAQSPPLPFPTQHPEQLLSFASPGRRRPREWRSLRAIRFVAIQGDISHASQEINSYRIEQVGFGYDARSESFKVVVIKFDTLRCSRLSRRGMALRLLFWPRNRKTLLGFYSSRALRWGQYWLPSMVGENAKSIEPLRCQFRFRRIGTEKKVSL